MSAVEVHTVVDGPDDGRPVVLSGAAGTDLRMWEPQLAPLRAAGYRVIRYDHRGHGNSPVPPGPYSLAELSADALALLDRLGTDRVHWVGLSLGGLVGLWLAEQAPQRLLSLTVFGTAPMSSGAAFADRAQLIRAEGTAAAAERSVPEWFTAGWRTAFPDRAGRYREMVAAQPAEGFAACCAAMATPDLADGLAAIDTPMLVVCGADDPIAPPEVGRTLIDTVPRARLEVVSPGAHMATAEAPRQVNFLLLRHLKEHS